MHIAMWSGPRNLSTAMMYSFGARADFDVMDEPFYGAYLSVSGLSHPMGDEIKGSMACDPDMVAQGMKAREHAATPKHLYTKQMTHHMVPQMPRDWFAQARHVFLIRHPARVIASYAVKREKPTLEDIGFVQQVEIFESVKALGQTPVVVDSFDIRANPEGTLRKLCLALDLAWDANMLSWPSGGHRSDGVWASHWYGAVHRSTGFADIEGDLPVLEADMAQVSKAAMPYYSEMAAQKI